MSAVVSLQLFQDSQHNGFNMKLQMSAKNNDLAVTTQQFRSKMTEQKCTNNNRSHGGGRGSGRGSGRSHGGGRGASRSNGASECAADNNNTNNDAKKWEFAPHSMGKPQKVTCDSVKDHVALMMQKTHQNGDNTAEALRNDKDVVPGAEPTRQTVKCTAENTKTEEAEANSQVEQQGCDLEHKEELMLHNAEKESHEDNKAKACALMFSCCNKTMQNRIEEM